MTVQMAPWLIWLLPIAAFLFISLILRPFAKGHPKAAGYAAIGGIGLAWALSLWVLTAVMGAKDHVLAVPAAEWLMIGNLNFHAGLLVDSLTAVMLVVVTTVSLLVQIYSQGYMKGDTGYIRYFAFMALFTAFMLGLVMADSLLLVYVNWEGVGLCSYLLIGFWFHKPSAANAAKKAFIVTRLGDVGLAVAILILYANTGTFDINQLKGLVAAGSLGGGVLTAAAIGIFAGAAGKSAQFPLHVWLPDAMEGPTPVSALIHAATMVAAGVFLVARTLPLFEGSAQAMQTVAVIGAITAIFAASMGLVMTDIKRVVAYSTISQLGYMMLGLATGGVAVGIFHLFNHAFFKALLFLGSGSVNHATGTFDMRLMGGLRKSMPWTFWTFVLASLSLAGIWPLAGFWSKDEILAGALQNAPFLFVLAAIVVFMTAFYSFRVIFLTFTGKYRGGAPPEHGAHGDEHGHKPHESPAVMVVPLVVLSIFAVASGWLNVTGGFSAFFGEAHGEAAHSFIEGLFAPFAHPLPMIALAVAIAGILMAWAMYYKRWLSAEAFGRKLHWLYVMALNKYWMDDLYEKVITNKFFLNGVFVGFQLFDTYVVDGAVNGVAKLASGLGRGLRALQTGQLQTYAVAIGVGVIAIVAIFLLAMGAR